MIKRYLKIMHKCKNIEVYKIETYIIHKPDKCKNILENVNVCISPVMPIPKRKKCF